MTTQKTDNLAAAWANFDPRASEWDFTDGYIHPDLCGTHSDDPNRRDRIGIVGTERLFAELERQYPGATMRLSRTRGEPHYLGIDREVVELVPAAPTALR